MSELVKISENEELRRVAELREKAIRDEKNGLRHAREDGLTEGIEIGTRQGAKEKSIEIVKKILNMEMTIEQIMQSTKLSKEEIEEISKEK